ncbi:hypothetical protein MLD38_025211 [Melastoma candidum]|uniref:Uncharacterized protein n=1 Tax=Melastoma candidum TaxID=119954 RepID=A0ACB9NZT9_9MYRT|nr:hypothetical protein MLD38_025211 [Melastoma candidum]
MIMEEPRAAGLSGSLRPFRFDDDTLLPFPDHPPAHPESSGSAPSHGADDGDFSETVFRYINRMLLEDEEQEEEDGDCKSEAFCDPLALQAAEKSLYEVICENKQRLPSGENLLGPCLGSPGIVHGGCSVSSCSDESRRYGSSYSFSSGVNSGDTPSPGELVDCSERAVQTPVLESLNLVSESTAQNTNLPPPVCAPMTPSNETNWVKGSGERGRESMMQFQIGVEEARRFLPQNYQIFSDFADTTTLSGRQPNTISLPMANVVQGKKNHERQNIESEEERSNKQLAIYVNETELSEMLDKILVCQGRGRTPDQGNGSTCEEKSGSVAKRNGHTDVAFGEKARSKKPGSRKTEVVDLRALLTLCAQAVSTGDQRTAEDYIRQIRRNSSPSGNGSQRLAHYFVIALEARLLGNGSRIYADLDSKKMSAVNILKAHHLYRSACPFQKLACIFANNNIMSLAEKATTLHIIDFGIAHGLQWPSLIFRLSNRDGGPPKLRITGIDQPERGFRPAERVRSTGQLLAKCCERFGVPFEYNAIAKKWEIISIEDLKLRKNETVVVNTLFRFKHLPDQTVVVHNPRDTVLNLIKRIKPDMFLQALVNGSFNAPFFVTRFREALFHYSSMFDAFDCNLRPEDQARLMYEREVFGREAVNVLACEGLERVERPETNKLWQVRLLRAGFKQLPLDPLLMKKLRFKLKTQYHEDFVIDVDGQWMLLGWKGRILFASSGWVPI